MQNCRCINLNCPYPERPGDEHPCQACGSDLLLNGRYRVIGVLNQRQNQDCIVYEAIDITDSNKPKVIKVLYTDDREAIIRFNRGADVLINYWVPGIPRVDKDGYFNIELSTQKPVYCLVMEKIEGSNLQQWLESRNNQPITEKQAINWLKQLAIILGNLHEQQFFHRDIKPSNIMLRENNAELVLIDIDAVRAITQHVLDGETITTIGTDGYRSPEQRKGRGVPQSDFYALGRTFVHLLTGKNPNKLYEDRNSTLYWHSSAKNLSKPFADFIDSLMAWSANDRPKNAPEILQCLETIERNLERKKQVKQDLNFRTVFGCIVFLAYAFVFYKGITIRPDGQNSSPINLPTPTPTSTSTFDLKCKISPDRGVSDENALALEARQILNDQRVVSEDLEIRQIQDVRVTQNKCDINIYIRFTGNSVLSNSLKNKIKLLILNQITYVGNISIIQVL